MGYLESPKARPDHRNRVSITAHRTPLPYDSRFPSGHRWQSRSDGVGALPLHRCAKQVSLERLERERRARDWDQLRPGCRLRIENLGV
jgi:hypothetical protein